MQKIILNAYLLQPVAIDTTGVSVCESSLPLFEQCCKNLVDMHGDPI